MAVKSNDTGNISQINQKTNFSNQTVLNLTTNKTSTKSQNDQGTTSNGLAATSTPTTQAAAGETFTNAQIATAATSVQQYVDTYKTLPNNVTINGISVSMPSFLELLTTSVININGGSDTTIDYITFGNAPNPRDTMNSGTMSKTEYLKIASDVKSFMDRTHVAPEYAYATSLGSYFGYQNMVYTYSKIMSYYATNNVLPNSVSVDPWKYVIANKFSVAQIASAATWVQDYVDSNNALPSSVTINNINVNMNSFLELLTTATLNINNGNTTAIPLFSMGNAPNPKDTMSTGNMAKAEYLSIASNVKSFMDSRGVSPEYAYAKSLGTYFGFQNMIYTYSKIMSYYSTYNALPSTVSVDSWKYVVAKKFTLNQIASSATWLQQYVDTNKKLPTSVTVGNTNVSIPSFLELLTTATLNINKGNINALIALYSFSNAPNPRDEMNSGIMYKSEYLSIASNVKSFMDNNGVAPEYAYATSLGSYFGYQNLVYTYSKIMNNFSINQILPNNITIDSWKTITSIKLTIDQVADAAIWVKNYVDNNNKLPDNVIINNINVNMPTFLEFLTTATLNINNGNIKSIIILNSFGNAPNPRDEMHSGIMAKSEYLGIASNVKSFMDSRGVAPEYAYATSLGTYFGYQNMVYTYSKIISYYSTNKQLPISVSIDPWFKFKLSDIIFAASSVKSYVDANKNLPNYVTINDNNISMPSFLELLTTATLNIKNNNINWIYLVNCVKGPMPRDHISSGNISQTEYLKIAGDVKSFMDSRGVAPEYAYNTSLGLYLGYENLIYMYSKVLDYYSTDKILPSTVPVNPWVYGTIWLGSTSYGYVEKEYYGNLSSKQTIVLIIGVHPIENGMHTAIYTALVNNSLDLTKRYVIYKIHVTQNPYDYNIGRMNGQLLAQKFVVPDVSFESPILAVDIHENKYHDSGYAYPRFLYVISNNALTISYANQIINKMPFLLIYNPPNPTSPQYVTIPIANKGINTMIYETYLYDSTAKKDSDANSFILALDQL